MDRVSRIQDHVWIVLVSVADDLPYLLCLCFGWIGTERIEKVNEDMPRLEICGIPRKMFELGLDFHMLCCSTIRTLAFSRGAMAVKCHTRVDNLIRELLRPPEKPGLFPFCQLRRDPTRWKSSLAVRSGHYGQQRSWRVHAAHR